LGVLSVVGDCGIVEEMDEVERDKVAAFVASFM
jgi:hypothetical protein